MRRRRLIVAWPPRFLWVVLWCINNNVVMWCEVACLVLLLFVVVVYCCAVLFCDDGFSNTDVQRCCGTHRDAYIVPIVMWQERVQLHLQSNKKLDDNKLHFRKWSGNWTNNYKQPILCLQMKITTRGHVGRINVTLTHYTSITCHRCHITYKISQLRRTQIFFYLTLWPPQNKTILQPFFILPQFTLD